MVSSRRIFDLTIWRDSEEITLSFRCSENYIVVIYMSEGLKLGKLSPKH